jgi:hypothetical protein
MHELDAVPYLLWMERHYGRGIVDELSELAHKTKRINRAERWRMIEVFKQKLTEIRGEK